MLCMIRVFSVEQSVDILVELCFKSVVSGIVYSQWSNLLILLLNCALRVLCRESCILSGAIYWYSCWIINKSSSLASLSKIESLRKLATHTYPSMYILHIKKYYIKNDKSSDDDGCFFNEKSPPQSEPQGLAGWGFLL